MIVASNRKQAKDIEVYCSYILGSEAVAKCLDKADIADEDVNDKFSILSFINIIINSITNLVRVGDIQKVFNIYNKTNLYSLAKKEENRMCNCKQYRNIHSIRNGSSIGMG